MTVHDPREQLRNTPKGWDSLVMGLVAQLDESAADITVAQVKEKFGGLRFYVDLQNQLPEEKWRAIYDLILATEVLSLKTCMECGNNGELRSSGGWLSTLCDDCHAKREKGNEDA